MDASSSSTVQSAFEATRTAASPPDLPKFIDVASAKKKTMKYMRALKAKITITVIFGAFLSYSVKLIVNRSLTWLQVEMQTSNAWLTESVLGLMIGMALTLSFAHLFCEKFLLHHCLPSCVTTKDLEDLPYGPMVRVICDEDGEITPRAFSIEWQKQVFGLKMLLDASANNYIRVGQKGVLELAQELEQAGLQLVGSGGTAQHLRDNGLDVEDVANLTKFQEMLGGRVKTLHPAVHAGILARDTQEDIQDLQKNGYRPVAVVVCNLYPFQQCIKQPDCTLPQAIEHIDIGGVTLLRAAAKNCDRVAVLSDPADYTLFMQEVASCSRVYDVDLEQVTKLQLQQKLKRHFNFRKPDEVMSSKSVFTVSKMT